MEPFPPMVEFLPEQIAALKDILHNLLQQKIDKDLQASMNQNNIKKVIDLATETFKHIGSRMIQQTRLNMRANGHLDDKIPLNESEINHRHQKDMFSIRDLFFDHLHIVKDISPVPTSSSVRSGQISPGGDSSEF